MTDDNIETSNGFPTLNIIKEVPLYKSHKTVRALEIMGMADGLLHFMDAKYPSQQIDPKMLARYTPKQGDFYVIYDDGYRSFSSRKAFLESYTLIEKADGPQESGQDQHG